MRRLSTIIAALVILVALGTYWYEEQQAEQSIQVSSQSVFPVQVAIVKRQSIPNHIQTVGTLKAWRQIDIAPQVAGTVVAVRYVPGAYVTKGTVLIQLDDRIVRAKLSSAISAMGLAKMSYQRALALARSGAESRQALDQMRATYHEAQAAVTAGRTLLSQTRITAAFAGYVGAKNVSIGDYVHKGQMLTTLTDRSKLLVDYQLAERYLSELKLGQLVTLTVPNNRDLKVMGKVTYISPTVDDSTHSVALQATASNPRNALAPGLFVKVQQSMGLHQHALVIPQAAIVPTITGPTVYIVRHHKAVLVNIKTGDSNGMMVEVLQGLNRGEHVIIAGQQQLKDGARVKEVSS